MEFHTYDIFNDAIKNITEDLRILYSYPTEEETVLSEIREDKRNSLIKSIEDIMITIQEAEMSGGPRIIELRNRRKWNNCNFGQILTLKPIGQAIFQVTDLSKQKSKAKFTLLTLLLSKIYKLLQTNTTCTRRELYYQNIQVVKSQSVIDEGVQDICTLLNVPSWELGILATSKGLVAGNLTMKTSDGSVIDCQVKSGVLIPQNIMGIVEINSNAKFILVVEKDAIFQKLLDEDIIERLGPLILMTGKGFPDINTRLLLKQLWTKMSIPIFVFTDSDPYGIEIMCVYRFGSLSMSHLADNLAVPSLRWLGVHPTDIETFHLPKIALTREDMNRLNDFLERPYVGTSETAIKNQINTLITLNGKTEIEALTSVSDTYITDVYLPQKICAKNFI